MLTVETELDITVSSSKRRRRGLGEFSRSGIDIDRGRLVCFRGAIGVLGASDTSRRGGVRYRCDEVGNFRGGEHTRCDEDGSLEKSTDLDNEESSFIGSVLPSSLNEENKSVSDARLSRDFRRFGVVRGSKSSFTCAFGDPIGEISSNKSPSRNSNRERLGVQGDLPRHEESAALSSGMSTKT